MNTITVTITVPDGVTVEVQQGAVHQTAPVATGPAGEQVCPVHHGSRFVPAGTSRSTGKAYAAFTACTDRACGWRAND